MTDFCIGPAGGCPQCYHSPCICSETPAQRLRRIEAEDRAARVKPEDLHVRIRELEDAIRAHRDARGDDRCWLDDETLYRVLPEGYQPPSRDTAVELDRCRQFIACRRHPATEYVSPEREIERLRALVGEAPAIPTEASRTRTETKHDDELGG